MSNYDKIIITRHFLKFSVFQGFVIHKYRDKKGTGTMFSDNIKEVRKLSGLLFSSMFHVLGVDGAKNLRPSVLNRHSARLLKLG